MRLRSLTAEDVVFTVDALPEDVQIRGNATASGDDNFDRETEESIIADLESGNDWAWCVVRVTAHWHDWKASAFLGGCSYRSEEDFRVEGGYYSGLKEEALANLNAEIQATGKTLAELEP